MRRHYLELWLLLLSAFVIFAVASAFEMPTIAGHEFKSSKIAQTLTAERIAEPLENEFPDEAFEIETPELSRFPVECDTLSHTILFIGDSMLEGLSPRLAAYCDANGHELYSVVWYSSTSEVWGRSDKLSSYIAKVKPSYIFVCLGANELFVPDIANRREQYVKKILADIGNIPYVWIGPPNWKADTGINSLIGSLAEPGSFFLSDGMSFERSKDGAHPTRTSAAAWLDSVARWMPANCAHPIRMNAPEVASGRPRRVFVHQPNEK